jgi:P-type Ca2+ transporter type 2C
MQKITSFSGLSQSEAKRLLIKNGFNELNSQKKQNGFLMLLKVLSEPMLLLLLSAGVIYLFMGELQDSLMLLFAILAVIALTLYQEIKTEKTLEALRDLSSPRALVIRDGKQEVIAGREVVVGDIVFVYEGDRVPADATVLSCENLSVDESLITGESLSVRKSEWDKKLKTTRPGGNDLPFVYSGSMVTSGRGIIRVTSTGSSTEIGKIGKSLENIKEEDTLLHKETAKIVRSVATVALSLCVLVFLVFVLIKHDFISGLLSGLTLAMAILPEEFPVVLTVFLTLGAWRISRRNVLTRRVATIETLGAATVLCTDKTGTLTFNKMELGSLYANKQYYELSSILSDDCKTLLEYGVLSSQKDPFDPIEKELQEKGNFYFGNDYNYDHLDLIKEYPLTKELLVLTHVWQSRLDSSFLVASKGAPEAIIDLCKLADSESDDILKKVKEMSNNGLRVLGVAQADFSGVILPSKQGEFKFKFIGLLGFIDQVRPSVVDSISEAYGAGIRVIMITGDYPGTAQFIAKKIGLKNADNYLTGYDLEKLSITELAEKIKTINIFARVYPEQKLLIVNALKANGEIVAMTGDGVNDAPALKAAHIGVAMGGRGTDVAREASSLILLDDDFSSIVVAVRLGRRIYSNLKSSMGYLLAVHVPIAGMSVIPIFFGLPIILFPAHIAFLELIIDPACTLAFEAKKEDDKTMKMPPRNMKSPMFTRKTVLLNLAQGFTSLLGLLFLLIFATQTGHSESEIRSYIFVSLVLSNLMLIVINMSWRKTIHKIFAEADRTLIIIFIGALACLAAVVYLPKVANLFHMSPLNFWDLIIIFSVVSLSLMWFEVFKVFRKKL